MTCFLQYSALEPRLRRAAREIFLIEKQSMLVSHPLAKARRKGRILFC